MRWHSLTYNRGWNSALENLLADKKSRAVPASRVGRLGRMAKLAGGLAGGFIAEGSRRLAQGERPRARDMLLTPGNARRLTDELAHMRGAAMKMGQMLSMETGEFLPPELTDILARLRSDGFSMPPKQLQQTMTEAYGEDWEELFYGFDAKPIAAASIGQVHRAYAPDGREIVLKIQYPGVARSIDSDVDNISGLLRVSGLLPEGIDIKPLLADAKEQLRDEADYLLEAEHLKTYGEALADDDRFLVPEVIEDLVREQVLPMTYLASEPIETIADLPQEDRDRLCSALMELMLLEFFGWRMVQTDPNFANYRYKSETGQLVLLDFGATRYFKAGFVNGYKALVRAAIKQDGKKLIKATEKLGYVVAGANDEYTQLVEQVLLMALESLAYDGAYDFGATDLPARLAAYTESIQDFKEFWQAPPTDAVFFHRKIGGIFMLASRMKARVNIRELAQRWV
ncbi:AarF/ABC1/UbiB kinase family protein [Halieaceae bacterium IMCC14734]|uniref:AarF/ABC1/UbiB kinase family protein n=1 Tax=Candidatus Litorirhabdus singularis TaxID=2518993 RepID=A0ABT3TDM2_9GAMM|nr:AarF/ABC1/UbiB kinase family protein [Candidatus Litorirhabdus singularis]